MIEMSSNRFRSAGAKLKVAENVDQDVDPELAVLVNDWFLNGAEEGMYQELVKDSCNCRPGNCPSLTTVKTNQMIWDFLPPQSRTFDKKLQTIENTVIKAAIILTKVVNGMNESPLLQGAMESLTLLGQSNRQINSFRRDLMKARDLQGEYGHLCSQNVKYTSFLFGDDVPKTIREIGDCRKIGNKLVAVRPHSRLINTRGRPFGSGGFIRGRGRGRPFNRTYPTSTVTSGDSKNFSRRGMGRPSSK
ncbi:hypothetical protein SNE40_020008 [Patella caerulea]|uniref:Uncharacterized protein n=1 Tax=Patella caerulea TaxID=87958 RepID=A0AAN8GA43_PATCE